MHDADDAAGGVLTGDGHREGWKVVEEVCRPVQRIDHPREAGRAGKLAALLGEHGVARAQLAQPVDDELLARPVGGSDKVGAR